jgi:pyrroline-5-carboxylate reductase
MLDDNGTLGVLGCGTVGEAIVRGLLRAGTLPPARLLATTRRAEAAQALSTRHGIRTSLDNLAVAREATALLVCLKPQHWAILDTPEMRRRSRKSWW